MIKCTKDFDPNWVFRAVFLLFLRQQRSEFHCAVDTNRFSTKRVESLRLRRRRRQRLAVRPLDGFVERRDGRKEGRGAKKPKRKQGCNSPV
jgi:hypothetical protein